MRTLLFLLVVVMGFAPASAQVKVILVKDTAKYEVTPTRLKKEYPPMWGAESPFKGKGKSVLDSINRWQARTKLFESLTTEANKVGLTSGSLFMDEFVGPSGKFDYVFFSIVAKSVTEKQEQALTAFLQKHYEANPFPITTPKGLYKMSALSVGGGYVKRTVRKGPGIISSLEDARKTTRPDTVKILLLNQLELTSVPQEVYRFPKLEEIDLSKNAIRHLPAELTGRIPTLLRLSLLQNTLSPDSIFMTRNKHWLALDNQGNKLPDIPKAIRKNRRLASLWVGNNPLDKKLANRSFRGLRRLNDLNLYNAGLSELPRRIARLKRLQILDLYYNNFAELPATIGRLKQLTQLAVSNNKLKSLPESLGRNKRLEVLYAHHNQLSELPQTITTLKSLRVLDIGYNWFSQFPTQIPDLANLEDLDMSNNNLTRLPAELGNLTKLKTFHLRGNPLSRQEGKPADYAALIDQLEANKTEVFY